MRASIQTTHPPDPRSLGLLTRRSGSPRLGKQKKRDSPTRSAKRTRLTRLRRHGVLKRRVGRRKSVALPKKPGE
jgi:hypothetical protein